MNRKGENKAISSLEKLHILLQPYVRKRDIRNVLQCSAKKAGDIFDAVLLNMKQKNYRIIDYNTIPTKLFMAYCEIQIEDFIRSADIEIQLRQTGRK